MKCHRSARALAATVALSAAVASLLAGCGAHDAPPIEASAGTATVVPLATCAPGSHVLCTYSVFHSGDVTHCVEGVRVCDDGGAWSPCELPGQEADAGPEWVDSGVLPVKDG